MNIKPFRDYDEHEVINLYAFNGSSATKGTFVELTSLNPSDYQGWSDVNAGANIDGTWSKRYNVKARVSNAASGSAKVLGMLLYDVTDTDENGQQLRFIEKYKKDAMCVVESGEAVPILTRGIVELNGFAGTPAPGSGGFVSNAGDGSIYVGLPSATGVKVGKFLSTTGADGYALFKIEL
jgi:hypothetical protein